MTILPDSFDVLANLAQHQNLSKTRLSYGTAGFRADADKTPLDFVMFRVGCLIGLRSRVLGGKACGAVVTASHNEGEDNGVKLVEPDGSMLDAAWESIADEAVNCSNSVDFRKTLLHAVGSQKVGPVGLVFIAYDTRQSSERLVQCLIRGCKAVGAIVENYHLLSTPVLHHIVRHANGFGHSVTMASVEGYCRMLQEGIVEVLGNDTKAPINRGRLIVDTAGGVGTHVFEKLLSGDAKDLLRIRLGVPNVLVANACTLPAVRLNENCGAEFAQKKRVAPSLIFSSFQNGIGADRVASFDGDADRLVYSYTHQTRGWRLLDGDKIAVLYAMFVNRELLQLDNSTVLSVGLVQTAYANGASTHFVAENMKSLTVHLAKTGVKFVEHAAKKFDIGMYFEANGHGTVIFSQHAIETLEKQRPLSNKLLGFYKLINQAVGDAISDCLGVETVLTVLGLNVEQWDNLYQDLPSRQGKIAIADRTLIKCTQDETRIISPESLQTEIDEIVAKFGKHARAFVRPSGTEDAARIYAEATTTEDANQLAFQIASAAWKAVGKPGSNQPKESEYL